MWSTILYVGPLTGLKGGETVVQSGEPDPAVMNACFTNRPAKKLLRLSDKWVVITPKAGRCVIFAGNSPHFVNPLHEVPRGCPRTTLLVNFWLYRPKQFVELRTISWLKPSEIRLLCRIRGDELNLVMEQVYADLLKASGVRPKMLCNGPDGPATDPAIREANDRSTAGGVLGRTRDSVVTF